MSAEPTVFLHIDEILRFALYGVSVLLDIDMRSCETERLFAAGNGSIGDYEFHRSTHAIVTGLVEEYEPARRRGILAEQFWVFRLG